MTRCTRVQEMHHQVRTWGILQRGERLIKRDSFQSRQHVMISLSEAEFLSLCMIYTAMLNIQKFPMTY